MYKQTNRITKRIATMQLTSSYLSHTCLRQPRRFKYLLTPTQLAALNVLPIRIQYRFRHFTPTYDITKVFQKLIFIRQLITSLYF